MTKNFIYLALLFLFLTLLQYTTAQDAAADDKAKDCEVCVGALTKLKTTMDATGETDLDKIEALLQKQCQDPNLHAKEKRFCWYIGAAKDSATNIIREASKPLSVGLPPEKICKFRLKKKDTAICALRYEGSSVFVEDETTGGQKFKPKPKPRPKKPLMDFAALPKMKIKDLKALLAKHELSCDGCVEKFDFIKKLKTLQPKDEL